MTFAIARKCAAMLFHQNGSRACFCATKRYDLGTDPLWRLLRLTSHPWPTNCRGHPAHRAAGGGNVQGRRIILAAVCCLLVAVVQPTQAKEHTERAIEKYRQMLKEDPWSNPGLLDADRGEGLLKTAAGPNNVSLEK